MTSGFEIPPRAAELLRLMAARVGDESGAYLGVGGRVNDLDRAVAYCIGVERARIALRAEAALRKDGPEAVLRAARERVAHFQRLRPLDGYVWWRDVRLRAWREIAEALQEDLAGAEFSAPAVAV